jgi:hypothetical protein
MTAFADDPTAADFGVLSPMIERDAAGVDAVVEVFRFLEIRD